VRVRVRVRVRVPLTLTLTLILILTRGSWAAAPLTLTLTLILILTRGSWAAAGGELDEGELRGWAAARVPLSNVRWRRRARLQPAQAVGLRRAQRRDRRGVLTLPLALTLALAP